MSDCPICGGDLARVGRIRLCRSCSEAFVAIGGAATLPSATKGDVVREAIEVQDRHATALAASEARVSALTAALRRSEQSTVGRVAAKRMACGDCGQMSVTPDPVIHAPDCPFAVLAAADRQPADGEG